MMHKVPQHVKEVIETLEAAGFEAFVVGGCVRDLLAGKEPKDWDVTTSAKPEQVMALFPDHVYENEFGTVGIKIRIKNNDLRFTNEKEEKLEETVEIVEVTTYRIESKYSDKRRPDEVRFAKSLEEDLSRRDFTVNALAVKIRNSKSEIRNNFKKAKSKLGNDEYEMVDLFGGQDDLKKQIIRAVGDANERFDEDALRMMRAVRFACSLNGNGKIQDAKNKEQTNPNFRTPVPASNKADFWTIEKNTLEATKKNVKNIHYISKERIKDELEKIILSDQPARGIELMHETGLLKELIPEIEAGYDVTQSHHHYFGPYNTVYKHLVASLEHCPSKKLEVRLAALFHDVGKPVTKRGEGIDATFYNHEYVGARMTKQILERLKFPRKVIDKTVLLVKGHMFYYNVDEVGESGVRRVVQKVGLENMNDLIDVRVADRLGSGVAKAVPYKLRHFKYMVDKVSHDPVSVKQLKANGNELMEHLGLAPGPKVGAILEVLLAMAIDDPLINHKDILFDKAKELMAHDLEMLRGMAKEKIAEKRKEDDDQRKGMYWVK